MARLDVKHFLGIYRIRLGMQEKGITTPSWVFKKWTREFVEKLSKMPLDEEMSIYGHSFLDSQGNIVATLPIKPSSSFVLNLSNEENVKQLIDRINELNFKHSIQEFDSGAIMIDLYLNESSYCIQIADNKVGLSKISNEPDFSTYPDSGYLKWNDFLLKMEKLIEKHT